MSDMSILQASM